MISLSISNGTATAVSIVDSGTSGYVLAHERGWAPGGVENQNTYAESRWVDGASQTTSKKSILSMNLAVRAWGTSYADLMSKVDALKDALSQFSYTITESYSGGSVVHTCMPAASVIPDYDPDTLRHNMCVITAVIPRQP